MCQRLFLVTRGGVENRSCSHENGGLTPPRSPSIGPPREWPKTAFEIKPARAVEYV